MLTQSATVKNAFNPSALRNPPVESKSPVETTSDDESLARSMHVVGSVLYYPRRTAIIHEDDPADRLYKVISGAVCTYKILSDGRRQIGGFYCRAIFSVSKAPPGIHSRLSPSLMSK